MKEVEIGQTRLRRVMFDVWPGDVRTIKLNNKYFSIDCNVSVVALEERVMMKGDNGFWPEWVIRSYDMDTLVEHRPPPKGPGFFARLWARLFNKKLPQLPIAEVVKE